MSTLLLEPLMADTVKWGRFSVGKGYLPPMGMISIYSYMKARGKDITFIDTQFGEYGEEDIKNLLARKKDLRTVGIPVFTNSAYYSFKTAKLCKETRPDIKIVLGGVHVTALPERSLDECPSADFIVLGEGEETLLELTDRIESGTAVKDIPGICYKENGKFHSTGCRPLIADLDTLPITNYDDIDLSKYVPHATQYRVLPNFPLITQRGCPYKCTFCDASLIHGKKTRFYSIARVMEELELLVQKHGAKGVYFQDSTFSLNREYVVELCENMIKKGFKLQWACNTRCDRVDLELLKLMKKAGCWMINYGIESANQESLDMIKKGIKLEQIVKAIRETKKSGIGITCSYILCLPGETRAMTEKTIKFSQELLTDAAMYYLPVPYPGTELAESATRDGGLRADATWKDYIAVDFDKPVYVNPLIGAEGMRYFYKKAYRDYYLNPHYILKMIYGLRRFSDVKRYARGLLALLNAFLVKS